VRKPKRREQSKGHLAAKLRRIKAIFFDVDGVLTDGRIYLGQTDDIKAYSTKDGFGIRVGQAAGLRVFLVTGRSSASVRRRAGELGVKVSQNVGDKLGCVRRICSGAGLELDRVAFAGDDLNDLKVLKAVGVAFAVANAADEVKAIAHYTTLRNGGDGAAREIIELILRSQQKWDKTVKEFLA